MSNYTDMPDPMPDPDEATRLITDGLPAPAVQRLTPAQARIDAVSSVLSKAYDRASTLILTTEETDALKADFPDEAFKTGAAGKDNLIYIEHAFLRDRLDTVLGMGQWAIVRTRPHWGEDFLTQKNEKAVRIYADCALVVRGCFVAEAIGDMVYYPNNASQSYGDAAEGSVTAALRRCAKNFGIGLQAWKKDWCAGWLERHSTTNRAPRAPQPAPPLPPIFRPNLVVKERTAKEQAAHIERMDAWAKQCKDALLLKLDPIMPSANDYAVQIGWIMPNECLADVSPYRLFPSLNLDLLPDENKAAVKKDFDGLVDKIQMFMDGEPLKDPESAFEPEKPLPTVEEIQAIYKGADQIPGAEVTPPKAKPIEVPRDKHLDPNSPDAPWRSMPMPWGKQAGVKLADLDKKYLYGLWANYAVETHYNGKPKRPETIAKDEHFREMLDQAGEYYTFDKKD